MSCHLSLVLRLFCFVLFCFVFVFLLSEAMTLRSIVLRYPCAPIDTYSYLTTACVLFRFSLFFVFSSLEVSLFLNVFVPLRCRFSLYLYGEYVIRFFLPGGVFPPCDHGLDCLHQLRIQSIEIKIRYTGMYVWSSRIAKYGSTGKSCQFCSWSAEEGKIIVPLSPFAPGNLVSRDGFDRPVPCQPAHFPYSG